MISGATLRDAIISASNNISRHRHEVDKLNVFPVPDGDTGTNMSMTMGASVKELPADNDVTVEKIADITANALLRGARGNSGVILSLLFRGISRGLKGLDQASGKDFAKAFGIGVEAAYKAVMRPTEGTILTVSRIAAEKGQEFAEVNDDPEAVMSHMIEHAKIALEMTPELLPVLKKAGVVDAGGKGLVLILEGMYSVIKEGIIIQNDEIASPANADEEEEVRNAAGEWEGEITFTYCTEYIVERDSEIDLSPKELNDFLQTIGDSIVVADDEELIKVHVHTDNPGDALQSGLKYGQLISVKIENMRKQHEAAAEAAKKKKLQRVDPTEDFGFVAVAAGSGITELFKDLGVNHVVSGGQTMNPSTEELLEAVLATPAKTVFILPNNKNIILAAEQTVELADRQVIVLHTRTIPQGLSAMLSFDPTATPEENKEIMTEAFKGVVTGQVTYAARDSQVGVFKIKEGDILGLIDGRLVLTEKDPVKAAVKVFRQIYKKEHSFVSVIYGEDVTEEDAQEALRQIKHKIGPDTELTLIHGKQPIYHFIISVE